MSTAGVHDGKQVIRVEAAPTLADALHDLSQPLTSVLFAVEMGRSQSSPEHWRVALDEALVECHRALEAMYRVQALAREVSDGDTAQHILS